MVTYTNNEQSFIAPDLETFGKAMDTLQQRHDEAVKALTEAETNIANLDINDVDKDIRAEMLQKVKDLENTFASGSLGSYNINEVLMTTKEVMSNPKFTQALTNQQNFRNVEKEINDRQDLTEGEKQWAIDKIRDSFEAKYNEDGTIDRDTPNGINNMGRGLQDENGNYRSYSEWTAKWKPVTQIDNTKLYDEMIKLASEDANNTSISKFDQILSQVSGQVINNITDATDKVNNVLPVEKLTKALYAAIRSYPGAEESLRQEYQYELDMGITTDDNYANWVENKFIYGIQSHAYDRTFEKSSKNVNSVKTGKSNGSGGGNNDENTYIVTPDYSVVSGNILSKPEEPINISETTKKLTESVDATDNNIRKDFNIPENDNRSTEKILNDEYKNGTITADKYTQLINDYKSLKNQQQLYNNLKSDLEETLTDQQKENNEYFDILDNFEYDYTDKDGNKITKKDYSDDDYYNSGPSKTNSITFDSTHKYGMIDFYNPEMTLNTTRDINNKITFNFDNFFLYKNNAGVGYDTERTIQVGKNIYKNIKEQIINNNLNSEDFITFDDNTKEFTIKRNREAFLQFSKFYKNAIGVSKFFNNTANTAKTQKTKNGFKYETQSIDNLLQSTAQLYNYAKRRNDKDYTIEQPRYAVNLETLNANDLSEQVYINDWANGDITTKDLNEIINNITSAAKETLKTASFGDIADGGVYIKGKNGLYDKVESDDIIELEQQVKSVIDDKNFAMNYGDAAGFHSGYTISFHGIKDKKQIDFDIFIENLHKNNKNIQQYENLASTRGRKEIELINAKNNGNIGNNLSQDVNLQLFTYYKGLDSNGDEVNKLFINDGENRIELPVGYLLNDKKKMYKFTAKLYELMDATQFVAINDTTLNKLYDIVKDRNLNSEYFEEGEHDTRFNIADLVEMLYPGDDINTYGELSNIIKKAFMTYYVFYGNKQPI